ncbi:MAG TPA: MFS transporter [Cellvibrio sp.]|nr:MFS transporter [Cellvibrio sp.]
MILRIAILIMSACGVISDSILIAFYPQFFEMRYGLTNPIHVGAYIAAISIAVMCALPFWAKLTRHIETLHLLWMTQLSAGILAIASAHAPSVQLYWVLTMLMFIMKASYLLLFPYLMREEKPENHGLVIGMVSVVVHVGAIFGASVGGSALENLGPEASMYLMAAGDFVQMGICIFLIFSGNYVKRNGNVKRNSNVKINDTNKNNNNDAATIHNKTRTEKSEASRPVGAWIALAKLSGLMLLFDMSAYLVRPFFSVYWESIYVGGNQTITGIIFAIPGMVAIAGLIINKSFLKNKFPHLDHTAINLFIGAIGLLLQASSSPLLVITGRCLYGWSLFQVVVKLEVTLFRISQPAFYDRDFAVTNFFQNLGVLLASFAAGYIVSWIGVPMSFALAAAGFILTAILDRSLFGVDSHHQHGLAASNAHQPKQLALEEG